MLKDAKLHRNWKEKIIGKPSLKIIRVDELDWSGSDVSPGSQIKIISWEK